MRTGTSVENTKMASQREFLPGHLTIFHGRTKKKRSYINYLFILILMDLKMNTLAVFGVDSCKTRQIRKTALRTLAKHRFSIFMKFLTDRVPSDRSSSERCVLSF